MEGKHDGIDIDDLLGEVDAVVEKMSMARDVYEKKPPTKENLAILSVLKDTIERTESKKEMKIREFEIQQAMEAISEAHNLDLCFMVDCTGSMASYIAEVKGHVKDFVKQLKESFPGLEMRLCFLGYRDHCDGVDHFSILNFTSNREEFEEFVGGVEAKGGGDAPEDINGAFQRVLKLKWEHAVRVVFHIGDAAPHGMTYGEWRDTYPDGHPDDKPIEDILTELVKQNVLYIFGRICSQTDKMIEVFQQKNILKIQQADLSTPEKLLEAVTKFAKASITASITATVGHGSSKSKRETGRKAGRYYLNPTRPDAVVWDAIEKENVTLQQFVEPEEMDDLDADLDLDDSQTIVLQISETPFAKGSMRLAYGARIDATESKYIETGDASGVVVLKEYFKEEQRIQDRERTVYEMEVGTIARYLAAQFASSCIELIGKPIEFVPIQMVMFEKRAAGDTYILEPYLDADLERFSNNGKYQKPGEDYYILHTFSHWTYCASGKKMMVVDLEGAILSDKIILTDPAIHAVNTTRFGKTNLGTKGMETFLGQHRCNIYCKELIKGKDWVNPLFQ